MMKRSIISVIVIFIVWSVLDFVIHGILLQSIYEATASLWRPMEEMNMPVMTFVTFAYSVCFVVIYGYFINKKSLLTGIKFGGILGLAVGISMGFGSYSYMPIPISLAWSWFAGTLIEHIAAGALVDSILKLEEKP